MEENKITEQESLLIIQQMIQTAKKEQKDNGAGWISWGWVLLVISILTFLNGQYRWREDIYFFWNLFGLFTLVMLGYSIIKHFFFPKKGRVRTYTTDMFRMLNIGFFIFLLFLIFAINTGVGPTRGFTLIIGLYGFWMLIYGTIFSFRPSVIAAFVTWAIAFAALFIAKTFADIMLFHAAAVLCGYIIPGHLAYREFRRVNAPVMA